MPIEKTSKIARGPRLLVGCFFLPLVSTTPIDFQVQAIQGDDGQPAHYSDSREFAQAIKSAASSPSIAGEYQETAQETTLKARCYSGQIIPVGTVNMNLDETGYARSNQLDIVLRILGVGNIEIGQR